MSAIPGFIKSAYDTSEEILMGCSRDVVTAMLAHYEKGMRMSVTFMVDVGSNVEIGVDMVDDFGVRHRIATRTGNGARND